MNVKKAFEDFFHRYWRVKNKTDDEFFFFEEKENIDINRKDYAFRLNYDDTYIAIDISIEMS
jgi:hypothetical protein